MTEEIEPIQGAIIAKEIGNKIVDLLNKEIPKNISGIDSFQIASTVVGALMANVFHSFHADPEPGMFDSWAAMLIMSYHHIGCTGCEITHHESH